MIIIIKFSCKIIMIHLIKIIVKLKKIMTKQIKINNNNKRLIQTSKFNNIN
jgi:hypothetical protein